MVSPMPLASSAPNATDGLDRALEGRAGLGHAEVQRPVAAGGELLVGLDHDHGVVVLDRDLEVVEVVLLEQARLPHGGLDQRLGGGLAVLLHQPRVQRAGVDADPDRDAGVLGGPGDLLDLVVELADVARVDPHRGAAGVDRGEDVLGLEVDVGDDRDLDLLGDRRQRVGVVLAGAGDPDDVAAGRGQLGDLLQRRVDVGRGGGAHRLHRDGRVAADRDLADLDLAGDRRRGRSTGGGRAGMPRASWIQAPCRTLQCTPIARYRSGAPGSVAGCQPVELDRVDDVGVDQQHRHDDQQRATSRRRCGSSLATSTWPGSGRPRSRAIRRRSALPQRAGDVPAVQRQQRDEVEDEQREVERGDQHSRVTNCSRRRRQAGDLRRRRPRRRPGRRPTTLHRAVLVALPAAEGGLRRRRPSSAGCAGSTPAPSGRPCRR